MSVLDRIMAILDRREVLGLRNEVAVQGEQIRFLQAKVAEQVSQIANANGRISRVTNANLELKRVLRENGINVDGMAA